MTKIVAMDEANSSPCTLLHQVLEEVDLLDAVVVIRVPKENEGEVSVVWSGMKLEDLVFAEKALHLKVEDALRTPEEDSDGDLA